MDRVKISCPKCELGVGEFGFEGEGLIQWQSYKVHSSQKDCITRIETTYKICCFKPTCIWQVSIPVSDLIKQTFQATKDQIESLVLIFEDLELFLKEYEANPSNVLEASAKLELYKSSQVEKIYPNNLGPNVGRNEERKVRARAALASGR